MRIILGFLSGVIGLLAGWFGLAALVLGLAGPDRDGGIAMGAFFNIGPIGGVVGFVVGVLLFAKIGIVSQGPSSPMRSGPTPHRLPRGRGYRPLLPSRFWRSREASPGGPGTN